MNLYEINKLKRDPKQDNLYNMFQVTYSDFLDSSSPFRTFEVMDENYMRLDLVSQQIYNSDNFIDILCHVNSIDNPLNILGGDSLIYPNQGLIGSFKTDDIYIESTPGLLLNAEKTTEIDENRKRYVESNYNLIPTANPVPKEPVKIVDDYIVIGN